MRKHTTNPARSDVDLLRLSGLALHYLRAPSRTRQRPPSQLHRTFALLTVAITQSCNLLSATLEAQLRMWLRNNFGIRNSSAPKHRNFSAKLRPNRIRKILVGKLSTYRHDSSYTNRGNSSAPKPAFGVLAFFVLDVLCMACKADMGSKARICRDASHCIAFWTSRLGISHY